LAGITKADKIYQMEFSFVIVKIIVSASIIAGISWYAGKNPSLAGLLIALPIVSVMTICFSYYQYRDMEKINQFASSIVASIPLSLLFFVPFILNRWLKWSFFPSVFTGFALLYVAYMVHSRFFKT
jgi:hypothetical protein